MKGIPITNSLVLAVVSVLLLGGCSVEPEGDQVSDPQDKMGRNSDTPNDLEISGGIVDSGSNIDFTEIMNNIEQGGGAGPSDQENCTGISALAEPAEKSKVDIIWVIDSSGSMMDEAQRITENINAFVDTIGKASIDYHVVILTTIDLVPPGTPLATSGNYLFVFASVDSTNSLMILRDLYGQYSHFLRPDAATHFIILTDDESTYDALPTPEERANSFLNTMQGMLGKNFFAHTISSEDAGGGLPCTSLDSPLCAFLGFPIPAVCGATAPGHTYWVLADLTNALKVSICETDWSQVFGPLTTSIIESAPLPCNYTIPPPPEYEELDPDKVNVEYISPDNVRELFLNVKSLQDCADNLSWYYDNPVDPKEILLCPAACQRVSSGGGINVTFGCKTIEVG